MYSCDVGKRAPGAERMQKLKVLIVEDEPLYREMLSIALTEKLQCEVTGVYSDAESVLERIDAVDAHVATLDIQVPGPVNGFQLGLHLKETHPALGVVLLSNYCEPSFMEAMQRRGLAGWAYLLKNSLTDLTTLHRALYGAANGEVMVDPAVVDRMRARASSAVGRLTQRQREVLELIVRGYSNQAIAEKLFVSRKTVENTINQIYQQLDINSKDPDVQPRVMSVMKYLSDSKMFPT